MIYGNRYVYDNLNKRANAAYNKSNIIIKR